MPSTVTVVPPGVLARYRGGNPWRVQVFGLETYTLPGIGILLEDPCSSVLELFTFQPSLRYCPEHLRFPTSTCYLLAPPGQGLRLPPLLPRTTAAVTA